MLKIDFSDQEKEVNNHIVETWNAFTKLPTQHPDEVNEFRILTHRMQQMMAMRLARKVLPEQFPIWKRK